MVWDGSACRVYGKHQFTSPIECSINITSRCRYRCVPWKY